ncbi:MAG: tetratricopeptide repeat protein [Candidatus Scalindua sp.]|nr:tetratricopeptide repeat protein [Candidatus Scalindua sp.]
MNNYHFSSGVPLASPITTPPNASSAPSHVVALEKVVRSESLFISRLQAGCLLYGFWIFFFTVLLTARFAFCDNQFISSLNAKVTGLRFFEGDVKGQPYGQRKYSTVFSKSATRYIYWEMTLAFPKSNRKSYFTIVSKFYNPHGNVMTRLKLQSNIEPGWTSSYHYHGYGWKTPGNWEIGTYRVDIFVDNQNVTSGTFTITYGGVPHKKSSPAADEADIYFEKGLEYYNNERWDEAIAEINKAMALNPEYKDSFYKFGLAHYKGGFYDKAITAYSLSLKLNPNDFRVYCDRGLAYGKNGQYDKAIADYDQAIKLDPKHAKVYVGRGVAFKNKGENEKAIADYTQAIKLNSTYALAYYNRGIAHNQKGDYRNALEDVEKAVDLGQKVDAEFLNKLRKASEKDLSSSSGADTRVSKSKEESSKTVEDLSKQRGEKENFIPTINGSVTELRFYESGMEDTPYGQRTYQTLFSQSGARYIYWELILAFPKQNRRTDFNIMAKYYDPEGNLIREWVTNSYIETGWTSSYHNSGYGWNEPGKWKQGTYRADLFVEGQRVASGTFTVTTGNLSSEKIQQPVREEDQKSGSGEQLHKSTENNRKEQHKEEDQVLHPADNQSMITGGEKVVIPSMNARVAGLRFYETGNSWKPCGKGEYGTSFPRSTTRNVNWELSLNYPSPTKKSYFTITAEYYDPHGNIIIRQSKESSIQQGRTSSSHFHGYGWSQPGNWETGTYRVDIIVEGEKVASGSFTITSGH